MKGRLFAHEGGGRKRIDNGVNIIGAHAQLGHAAGCRLLEDRCERVEPWPAIGVGEAKKVPATSTSIGGSAKKNAK